MGAVLLCYALAEAAPPGGGPAPDLEFLEFLGGWHTEDGKTVDPFALDEMPMADEQPAERSSDRSARTGERSKTGRDRSPSPQTQSPEGIPRSPGVKPRGADDRIGR